MAGAFLVITIGLLLSAATLLFELLKNGFHRDTKESVEQDLEAETGTRDSPDEPQYSSAVEPRPDDDIVIIASNNDVPLHE